MITHHRGGFFGADDVAFQLTHLCCDSIQLFTLEFLSQLGNNFKVKCIYFIFNSMGDKSAITFKPETLRLAVIVS